MSDVTGKNMLIVDERNFREVEKEIANWSKPLKYTVEHRGYDTNYACFKFEHFVSSVQQEVFDEILRNLHEKQIDYATPDGADWQFDEEFKFFFEVDEETGRVNNDSFEELALVDFKEEFSKLKALEENISKHIPYNQTFLDVKKGDIVWVSNEYSHDEKHHLLYVQETEEDKEYATESNPTGRRYFGVDLNYWDDEIQDYEDDDYITVVDESNFHRFASEDELFSAYMNCHPKPEKAKGNIERD